MSYNKALFKQMVEESKKKKSLSKPKDRIFDPMGQWKYPGEITVIPGDSMATHGYGNVPLYVEANNGFKGVIPPNVGNIRFPGATQFTEYPLMKNGGDISIPDLEEGNWLNRYDDGEELKKFYPGGVTEDPPTKIYTPQQIKAISSNIRNLQNQPKTKGKALNKPIATKPTVLQAGYTQNLDPTLSKRIENEAREKVEEERQIQERKNAEEFRRKQIAGDKTAEFTFPNGKTKTADQMDWREKAYVAGKNLGSFNNNNWTDWINPMAFIGSISEGVGTAPYLARETNSVLPYVTGIGTPLLTGALAGMGAKTTGQFVNNLVNPLAGFKSSKPVTTSNIITPVANATPTPWSIQELPGLHLKSTMSDGAISKIVEPKTGLINVDQALAIIGKESGGSDKVALIKKGFGETIPKKMDFNDFRKTVQDKLIPLERQFTTDRSNYGISSLGYPSPKRTSFETALANTDNEITNLNKQIEITSSPIKKHYGQGLNGETVYSYTDRYGIQYYPTEAGAIAGQKRSLADLNESLNNAISNKANNLSKMQELPLENQTLILGNKNKFGKGSSAHDNPEETLGHIHFLRDAETPDILTVTQIQSDAFQGTNRIMPKTFNKEQQLRSLAGMEDIAKRQEELVKNAKQIDSDTWELPDGSIVNKSVIEQMGKGQSKINAMKKAEIENFTQKQLLDKNHQERYLQELVNYAGERGDVNKVRVPTSETAAKIQGYSKHNPMSSNWDYSLYPEELNNLRRNVINASGENYDDAVTQLKNYIEKNNPNFLYSSEHQTILKKYSEQPKTIKKLFGQEPKMVTDSKGNTWYEFDIPERFKGMKGEIKAFSLGGQTNWLNRYEEGGQLPKAQIGKELSNDLDLANQKKQQLLNWYQGRINHPDPRISTEAKQVLENMNNNYSESFPSSAIQYKPLEQFIVASKYGSYDPRQHKVQLTNPNISFNDEISKARYLPKKLIKSNREEYENMYNTSLSDEVRGHELLHYFLEKSAMPVIGTKHNKNIYSGYTDPDTYTNLLYEREGKPDLKGRDKLGFTQGAKGAYTWLTGTANTDLSPLPFKKPNPKKMFNQEMYRALMDFRNEFQIDPSKNTTPEDFKNIYQKIQENYQKAIKEKDNNKTLRYEHFLDLFNIHGNDFEKLNNLNNLLVGRPSLKQTMARNGGFLPKAQTGDEVSPTTLLTPKKIGEIRTVAGNLNEQKIYPENFKVRKMVYDPNCPDPNGLGCSYQAMRNASNITGLKPLREHYPLGNAGYVQAIGERMGMQKIFEQEGAQAKYSNAGGPGWKYFTPKDYGKVKPGDIFLLDPKKGEDNFTYAPPAGFTTGDLSGAPHVGVAVGHTKSGVPVISHGAAKGPKKGVNVTESIHSDGSLSGFGERGNYYIKAILRPSEIRDDNVIENIKYVTETGEERAKRKQETTSSAKFYLNPNNEQSLQNKLPVGYQFSGANVQQETKNKLINWFNDKSLDKELQGKFGITASELANIKPVVFGIAGQETTFNNVNFLPGLKDQYGNITNTGNSKGLFQIKYESLTPKERKIIGIKSPNDLLDDKKAYMAAVLRVMNSKKRMDSEIEQGTHPELTNTDPYFRAAYYYNSPGRAVSSAKSWAKGKDDVTWNPNTWTNKLASRERSRDYKLLPNFFDKIVSAFAPVDPEYQKRIELRMDQGSYPFKVMQKAKELGVSHNFEEGEDLEEIVIHGTRKGNKNQRFVKYTKGGETNWLNNYK